MPVNTTHHRVRTAWRLASWAGAALQVTLVPIVAAAPAPAVAPAVAPTAARPAAPASAPTAPTPARTSHATRSAPEPLRGFTLAITPLTLLGAEQAAPATNTFTQQVEAAAVALGVTKISRAAEVTAAIKAAKQPLLRNCDGESTCLATIGKLVGATIVVSGEIGGLGDAQVVYLTATDVARGSTLRSTTVALHNDPQGGVEGALIRLLAPDRFVGTLAVNADVAGASVFVNGQKLGSTPLTTQPLPVGTHALRVTHPEYRDFVRFVDIAYNAPTTLTAEMAQYAVIQNQVSATHTAQRPTQTIIWHDPPWYRRWYVIAGGAALLGVVAGVATCAALDCNLTFDDNRSGPSVTGP